MIEHRASAAGPPKKAVNAKLESGFANICVGTATSKTLKRICVNGRPRIHWDKVERFAPLLRPGEVQGSRLLPFKCIFADV
jgi:hypothetical protein